MKIGRDRLVSIYTRYTLNGLNPCEGEILRTSPDQPWAHSASCTMGIGFPSPRYSGRSVALITHSNLALRLKKNSRLTTVLPLWAFMAFSGVIYLYHIRKRDNIYLNVERKRFFFCYVTSLTEQPMYLHRLYVAWRLPPLITQQCHLPLKVERYELFVRPCAFHTIRNRPLTSACGQEWREHTIHNRYSFQHLGIKNTSTLFGCDQLRAPNALLQGRSLR